MNSPQNVGAGYWLDRDQARLAENIAAAMQVEQARRELIAGIASPGALAYARFLSAVENDATFSLRDFGPFRRDDAEVVRRFPFLTAPIELEPAP